MKYSLIVLSVLISAHIIVAMELPEKSTKKEESEQSSMVDPTTFASYSDKQQQELLIEWNKLLFDKNQQCFIQSVMKNKKHKASNAFYLAENEIEKVTQFLHRINPKRPWISYLRIVYDRLLTIRTLINEGISRLKGSSIETSQLLNHIDHMIKCVKAAIKKEEKEPIAEKKLSGKTE